MEMQIFLFCVFAFLGLIVRGSYPFLVDKKKKTKLSVCFDIQLGHNGLIFGNCGTNLLLRLSINCNPKN
ncbi:hypothetical protein, partial [Bacillus cereus]|uniref:hypothetical protein n=1 Tax=Bacillus cereus TaxID=1396 RepID=UPI003671AAC4